MIPELQRGDGLAKLILSRRLLTYFLSVAQGAMQQLLLWLGLLELISGVPAIIQTLKGSERMPGDFGHAPPLAPLSRFPCSTTLCVKSHLQQSSWWA